MNILKKSLTYIILFVCISSSSQAAEKTLFHIKQNSPFKRGLEIYFDPNQKSFNILKETGKENIKKIKNILLSSNQKKDLVGLALENKRIQCSIDMDTVLPVTFSPEIFKAKCKENPISLLPGPSKNRYEVNKELLLKRCNKSVLGHFFKIVIPDEPLTLVFNYKGKDLISPLTLITDLKYDIDYFSNLRVVLIGALPYDEITKLKKIKLFPYSNGQSGILGSLRSRKYREKIHKKRIANINHRYPLAQFVQWLTENNPKNKVSVITYANELDYKADCQENKNLEADAYISDKGMKLKEIN